VELAAAGVGDGLDLVGGEGLLGEGGELLGLALLVARGAGVRRGQGGEG
jgi:hypothetical protein